MKPTKMKAMEKSTLSAGRPPCTRILGIVALGIVAMLSVTMAAPAHAQRTRRQQDSTSRTRRPSSEDKQRAVELFKLSEEAYQQGRFRESAALVRRAYTLAGDPILLYNLGRALESAGDDDEAIDAFSRYLDEAKTAPNRGQVEQRLATLKRKRDERKQLERAAQGTSTSDPEPEEQLGEGPADTPRESGDTRRRPIAPWIVAGVGGLVLLSAIGPAVLAENRTNEAEQAPSHREAVPLAEDADRFAKVTNGLLAAGGAILLGGLVWGLVATLKGRPSKDSSEAARKRRMSISLAPRSVVATVTY